MSNTSEVTPYVAVPAEGDVSTGAGVAVGAAVGACLVAGVALATWLNEDTDAQAAALQRSRAEGRAERLSAARAPRSTALHLRDVATMLPTARRLQYRVSEVSAGVTVLERPGSGRLALVRNAAGGIDVVTSGGPARVRELVREHTRDRAIAHLSSRGMRVESATLPDGRVQIVADETRDGHAHLQVEVRENGTTWVDVAGVEGPRCEDIVGSLAEAVGGKVHASKKKDAWFRKAEVPVTPKVRG